MIRISSRACNTGRGFFVLQAMTRCNNSVISIYKIGKACYTDL